MKTHVILFMAVIGLLGCQGNSKLRNLGNSELAAKHYECLSSSPTAPGKATACENIRKECERRRKEGNYAC